MTKLLKLGKVGRPHGYEGGFQLHLMVEFDSINNPLEWVFLEIHDENVPFRVTEFYSLNDKKAFLKLEDFEDEKSLTEVVNNDVFVTEDQILDEAYLIANDDIVGWMVINRGDEIGIINNTIDNKGQILLEVMYQGQEILLPLIDSWILDINEDDHTLNLDLPEGLLEL